MTSPSAALLRELRGVTRNAKALTDLLATLNGLPDDFPQQSLIDICGALIRLPLGSAEGCKIQLDYAHRRLPGIRRAHILDEEDIPNTPTDQRPPVMRDSPLDDRIAKLAFSVSSARELYSDPTTGELDNEIAVEPALPTAGVPEVAETIAVADTVAARFDTDADELSEIAAPDAPPAIALGQHLRDVSGFARLTRAELRLGAFLDSQLTSLRYGTLNALAAIKDDLQDIANGVVFIHGYVQKGRALLKRIKEGDITLANDLISGIVWVIERAEAVLAGKDDDDKPSDDTDPELTQEEAEAQARELILAGRRVPAPVARLVRRLNLSGTDGDGDDEWTQVPDLGLLRDLPGLVDLDLFWARFGDFGALASLRGLAGLRINLGGATDLAPLAGMTALTNLNLHAPQVTDLTPFAGMYALTKLWLLAPRVTDLAPLSSLTALETLQLEVPQARNLAPLAEMTSLRTLSIRVNRARDLSPLSGLHELRSFTLLEDTDLWDLAPLAAPSRLVWVDLSHAHPDTDMAPIAHVSEIIPPKGRQRPPLAPRPGS